MHFSKRSTCVRTFDLKLIFLSKSEMMADVSNAELKLACNDQALANCERIADFVKFNLQKKCSIGRTLLVSNILSSVTSSH